MPIFGPLPLSLPQQRRAGLPPGAPSSTGIGTGTAAGTSTVQAVAPFGAGAAAGTSTVAATGASIASAIGTATGSATVAATASTGSIFPLTVSSDGRYLKQSDGSPFLICADSTWSLGVNIALADIGTFLGTITGQGFNTVMMNAIEHHFTVVKPPNERGSLLPFTKRLDGAAYTGSPNGTSSTNGTQGQFAADNYSSIGTQSPDWTFPNNSYWLAIETILNACLASNVLVFVWPAYLGFHAGDEGWMAEMVALDAVTGAGGFTGQPWADNTKSKLWNYGAWIADRWKAYPNIVWVMGGDYGANSQPLTTTQRTAVNNVLAGMKSVSGQASVMFTGHWERPCLASDTTLTAGSWDLNLAYADEAVAELCRRGYSVTPATPTFLGEYNYEDGVFGGSVPYRKYLYWGFLGGVAGGFFGQEQLWRFDDGSPGTDWKTLLTTQGTLDASRQFGFWKSKPWHRLKPSGLDGMGTLITAGGGTASPQSTSYVAAACTPEGDLLLAYVPPAHTGSITVDMTKLSATMQARWFDPSNATYTTIGAFSNTGTHAFTTPATNSAGDTDFLLVLETPAGAAVGAGSASATGASIAASAGTASGTSTATAAASATVAASGSIAGTSTATAAGASLSLVSGTSAGVSTAAAVGASLAAGAGTSTGVATAAAPALPLASGTGTSAGSASEIAIGSSFAAGAGTAAGVATATATGAAPSTGQGVGTAAGTGTAAAVGAARAAGIGQSTGTSTMTATGAPIWVAAGAAGGSAIASGISGDASVMATGVAAGTSTVTGVGWVSVEATGLAAGTSTAVAVTVDATTAWENAIYQWVLTGSGLDPDHVIWATAGNGGPTPAGLYISMRIIDIDSVSDDWLISRRQGSAIVHHIRGTRHPILELTCSAGSSYGAKRAELVLARVTAAVMLPSVAKALRQGDVGVGAFEKVRVIEGRRSGMFDPKAVVQVMLHIKIDVSETGGEFVSAGVTTPGGVTQTVAKP